MWKLAPVLVRGYLGYRTGALCPSWAILALLWVRKETGEGKGSLRPQAAGPEGKNQAALVRSCEQYPAPPPM
jgi:hypothetical protein